MNASCTRELAVHNRFAAHHSIYAAHAEWSQRDLPQFCVELEGLGLRSQPETVRYFEHNIARFAVLCSSLSPS